MNLLTEKVPDFLIVGDEKIKIKTDFFLWVNFIIACENNNVNEIERTISDLTEKIPKCVEKFASACINWLFPESSKSKKASTGNQKAKKSFDFDADGNIIYCELWQHFPNLMERGITFHEGMELIKLLLHNENTMLWHVAFARCGDFSKMDKEHKEYWLKERKKFLIKSSNLSQEELDKRLYNAL